MREIVGKSLRLKHHPFPFRDKKKKEYIIGEALLRWKGMAEEELETLRNVDGDPPDLVFRAKDSSEIKIEITESVPYDRNSEAKSANFLNRLRSHLRDLGTRPTRLSNIFVSREPFDFPSIRPAEIKNIATQIDEFFRANNFKERYEIIQEIMASPIRITFIPALGAWAGPAEAYEQNLRVQDITGYPLDKKELEHTYKDIIKSKSMRETTADILVIFHGTLGIAGLDELSLDQMKGLLTSELAYPGIYIVEIIQSSSDYWVHVVTVRGHPSLEGKAT